MRTIRPLEADERILAVGAKGSYADLGALNAGSKEFGYRVNATFVDQFADDTLGVALAAALPTPPVEYPLVSRAQFSSTGSASNCDSKSTKKYLCI